MIALITMIPAMADTDPYGPARTGGDYSGPRWYGYFYNNHNVSANANHTNITMVGATVKGADYETQESEAKAHIEAGLGEAKNHGEQAMVDVESIVFIVGTIVGDAGAHQCYFNNPNALADFQDLVQTLEDDGYLIPNHPESSTVSSFYVADEPDNNCLPDVEYQPGVPILVPNPALLNAINAIRQGDTENFPLATIVRKDSYSNMETGLGLFDWVGLDDYDDNVTDYVHNFGGFEGSLLAWDVVGGTPQHFFLVPLVSFGIDEIGVYTDATPIQAKFNADNNVVGIMPFKWNPPTHPDGTTDPDGMNATSSWAPGYISLGNSILTGTPLASDIPSVEITVIASYSVFN
jgi:hypothetical protein